MTDDIPYKAYRNDYKVIQAIVQGELPGSVEHRSIEGILGEALAKSWLTDAALRPTMEWCSGVVSTALASAHRTESTGKSTPSHPSFALAGSSGAAPSRSQEFLMSTIVSPSGLRTARGIPSHPVVPGPRETQGCSSLDDSDDEQQDYDTEGNDDEGRHQSFRQLGSPPSTGHFDGADDSSVLPARLTSRALSPTQGHSSSSPSASGPSGTTSTGVPLAGVIPTRGGGQVTVGSVVASVLQK